jgi:toxin ParE1/3/4
MNYSFHDQATDDVAAAKDYYFQHAGGQVATRFISELERVIHLLLANPGFGTPIARQRRSFPLKGFPYSLVYRVEGDQLRVLVIRHQRQRPGFASGRH